jgi:hypothetical protein
MPRQISSNPVQQNPYLTRRIESPEMLSLKESAKKILELSFFKALGNYVEPEVYPLSSNEDSIENLIHSRIVSLSPERQALATASFATEKLRMNMLRNSYYKEVDEQGIFTALNTSESIFDRAENYITSKGVDLTKKIELTQQQLIRTLSFAKVDTFKMHLELDSMVCDYGGNSDEIAISAVYVNSIGESAKIAPYLVSDDFNLNDVIHFPGNKYITWDLLKVDATFPKKCICTFILAELDNGGLADWVDKFYHKLSDKLKELIKKAAGYIPIPVLGPIIGEVVAEVVGWLLDLLFGWFKDVWEDDLFPPQTIQLNIPDESYRFANNGERQAYNVCKFEGYGSRYTLNYTWQIERVFKIPDTGLWPIVVHETNGIVGAIVYRDVFFGGEAKYLGPGKHIFKRSDRINFATQSFDKDIDSIKVGTGYVAYAYKTANFTGERLELYSDNNVTYLDDNWRDQISSIIIEKNDAIH